MSTLTISDASGRTIDIGALAEGDIIVTRNGEHVGRGVLDGLHRLTALGDGRLTFRPEPIDYTFTATLKRNIQEGLVIKGGEVGYLTWQGAEAYFICKKIVEPWDPGHCGLA